MNDAVAVLEGAQGEMNRAGDAYTSVEHLLLALATSKEAVGELLRDAGLTHRPVGGGAEERPSTTGRSRDIAGL